MKRFVCIFLKVAYLTCYTISANAQYDSSNIETKWLKYDSCTLGIQKMSYKGNHLKVKYFAERDLNTTVYQRYINWSAARKVIAVTSGTYMTSCDVQSAKPIGLCIDSGRVVNETLEDRMDGLIMIDASGRLASTDLKNGNLIITKADNTKKTVDIRNNAYDRITFIKWAKERQVTVFQAHLLVHNNKVTIANNSSAQTAFRRFLAVCKKGNEIYHYILSLKAPSTLLNGTQKAYNYLTKYENATVVFMINLEAGCHNVYRIYSKNGLADSSEKFNSNIEPSSALNLLAYYFE